MMKNPPRGGDGITSDRDEAVSPHEDRETIASRHVEDVAGAQRGGTKDTNQSLVPPRNLKSAANEEPLDGCIEDPGTIREKKGRRGRPERQKIWSAYNRLNRYVMIVSRCGGDWLVEAKSLQNANPLRRATVIKAASEALHAPTNDDKTAMHEMALVVARAARDRNELHGGRATPKLKV
ncbi:hypothetical protein S7711_11334 [Stachybotrys chartarum IBT 7711]|uniref:Uncharacterized protein n=1 Tax=Stachybotrys chartarum (strain CBS 109288 / IBT 7711) TaxID=1280523 RepID=A0A084B1U1_STACB|nr:hypothetical protein S7711_11334 [Stachybotrys chartarum IBT 7711]